MRGSQEVRDETGVLGLGVRQEPCIERERKEQSWYRADVPMDGVMHADSGFSDYQGVKREHDPKNECY